MDTESFSSLFTALVAWAPRLKKDKKLIKGVLRRGTKLLPGLHEIPYEERVRKLNIPSMAYRRARGDMIEVYKYTHDLYDTKQILELDTDNTRRGHNLKLKKKYCRTATRQNFFTFRVVNGWNSLPANVVNAPSLNSFKSRIDSVWKEHKFETDLSCPLPIANLEFSSDSESEEVTTS